MANSTSEEKKVRIISREDFVELQLKYQPSKWKNWSPSTRRRQMHKVSPQVRGASEKSRDRHVYDPIMVSLGPYHHGKPALKQAEDFKYLCLHWCAGENDLNKCRFYNRILGRIDQIKGCYADASAVGKYDDKALTMMMLLDSCFLLSFIENRSKPNENNWQSCLGVAAAIPFTLRDIMVLENQIPFFVLKLLIDAKYDEAGGKELLQKFLSWSLSVKEEWAAIPRQDSDPPLHILEACWRVIAESHEKPDKLERNQCFCRFRLPKSVLPLTTNNQRKEIPDYHTSPPVTDLKAKGISFRPSSTHSIRDIKFKSCGIFGAKLHLPVRTLSDQTQVLLSNMIAYEVSPDAKTNLEVLSYTNFMKSLIETPEDVKELLEKRIFQSNRLANLEQVVQLFNSIDTFGIENSEIYKNVISRVGEHCDSKSKTWVAELINTRLKSPWTIFAMVVAGVLLALTIVQTHYTINPK